MHRTITAAGVATLLGTQIASGATLGTRTITNAQHAGQRGASGNTISNIMPAATAGTIRRIDFTGSLTKVAADTWAKEARVSPTLGGLAVSQNYIQFSPVESYSSTMPVSGTIYCPGGISANATYRWEHYDIVDDNGSTVADSTSTITYTFDDGYAAPGGGFAEFSGALSSADPTFNRAVRFAVGLPIDLSPTATAVYYHVQPFYVASSGAYTFATAGSYDTYTALYTGSFNPANAVLNCLETNNEAINTLRGVQFGSIPASADTGGTSRIDWDLFAGTQYYAVTTTFANGQTGIYTNLVVGPGDVALGVVPEPGGAVIVLAAGLVGRVRPRRVEL